MEVIDSLTDEQVSEGLVDIARKAQQDYETNGQCFPPGIPEFISHCKKFKHASHKEFKPNSQFGLPRKKAQKETANKHLEEIRESLKGHYVEVENE